VYVCTFTQRRSPTSIGIDLREEGVVIEYLDGRTTLYRGVPDAVEGSVTAGPGKETHVLVTDPTETEGVMTYVNDYNTDDEILEDSGVGRVIVEDGERDEVFPGVIVGRTGQRNEVIADPDRRRSRVRLRRGRLDGGELRDRRGAGRRARRAPVTAMRTLTPTTMPMSGRSTPMSLAKPWRDLDRSLDGPERAEPLRAVRAGRRGGGHGRVRDGVLRDELKEALAYRDADKVRWEVADSTEHAERLLAEHVEE